MDAVVVYQIVKALPAREQNRLFAMLQNKLQKKDNNNSKSQKRPLLNDEEATMYLIENVFNNKRQ